MALVSAQLKLERPTEIALRDNRVELTWAQVDDSVNGIAAGLAAMVRRPKRRVAALAHNAVEVLLLHVGAIHAGVAVVSIGYHLTADEVHYIIEDSESEALFVGPETAEVGRTAAQRAGVATVVGWRCPSSIDVTAWAAWVTGCAPTEPSPSTPTRPTVLYTSGTTGRPKAVEAPPVQYSGGTVAEYLDNLKNFRFFMRQHTHLVCGPLYHTGPAVAARVLAVGRPVVVLDRFDPEQVLAAIDSHRVESTLMVPTHFSRLLALPEAVRAKYDVSSLQLVVHTGAACPPRVKRAMIEWFGPVLVETYGGTEVGSVCKIDSTEWLARPGSVGTVQPPFSRAMIVDHDEAELPPNRPGRLYFEDPTGRGLIYAGDPEKTAAAHLRPGVFTLGDIGYIDEEGYVFITDRHVDMIVSGGVNIYPAEVELALGAHPAVNDVAVIGVPDPDMGESVKALVVLAAGAEQFDPTDLVAYCRERLAAYKCPRTIDIVDTLGRSALGKLNKRMLRAPYWSTERTIGG